MTRSTLADVRAFVWLLHHELRLLSRDARSKPFASLSVVFLFALLHVAAIPLALGVGLMSRLPPSFLLALVTGAATLSLLTLWARALTLCVQSLYERGDVELLVTSPFPPRAWFAVRASAIALRSALEYAVLLLPVANVFIAFGQVRWLLVYVSLPLGALLATSVALWLALGLLRWLGPRRTRLFAQIFATLIAVGAALMLQVPSLYWEETADASALAQLAGLPDPDSPHWFFARVVMGVSPWAPVVAMCGLVVFVLSVRMLAEPFIQGLTTTAQADGRLRRAGDAKRFLFHVHAGKRRALIRKELRVALRDPWLMTQLLQQNVFVLPATLMFTRWKLHGVSFAWLGVVMCAGTSASALAWLASAGEEAPDLIGTAPITALDRLGAQLVASLCPVVALTLACCAVLALSHPVAALWVAGCSLANALCNAGLNLRLKRPGKRADFRRRNQANIPGLLGELAFMSIWVAVCLVGLSLPG